MGILEAIYAWPLSAWLAVLALVGPALWKPTQWMIGHVDRRRSAEKAGVQAAHAAQLAHDASTLEQMVARCHNLEDIVDVLRVALDRGRIRENALITVAELMLFGIRHLHETPELIELKGRCEEILKAAQRHAAGEFSSRKGV